MKKSICILAVLVVALFAEKKLVIYSGDSTISLMTSQIDSMVFEEVVTLPESSGEIFNVWGLARGAFDLVADTAVSVNSSSLTKDLMDVTPPYNFNTEMNLALSSANGSKFREATISDYASATVESIIAQAFYADQDTTAVLEVGSVFVANLGSDRGYAIVKVTEANPTSDEAYQTRANLGVVKFNYKYVPTITGR